MPQVDGFLKCNFCPPTVNLARCRLSSLSWNLPSWLAPLGIARGHRAVFLVFVYLLTRFFWWQMINEPQFHCSQCCPVTSALSVHGLDQLTAVVCSLGKGIEFAVGIAVVQHCAAICTALRPLGSLLLHVGCKTQCNTVLVRSLGGMTWIAI